jgi:hypothetical protein
MFAIGVGVAVELVANIAGEGGSIESRNSAKNCTKHAKQ